METLGDLSALDSGFGRDIARDGDVKLLKWAKEKKGYEWDGQVCRCAAKTPCIILFNDCAFSCPPRESERLSNHRRVTFVALHVFVEALPVDEL